MLIKRKSTITGIEHVRDIPVDPKDLFAWEAGDGSVSEIMPYLSREDRDYIRTGITKEEWREFFQLEDLEN
jgi:hypothetical protein